MRPCSPRMRTHRQHGSFLKMFGRPCIEDDVHITDHVRFIGPDRKRTIVPLRRKVITIQVLDPAPKKLRPAFGGQLAAEAGFTFD